MLLPLTLLVTVYPFLPFCTLNSHEHLSTSSSNSSFVGKDCSALINGQVVVASRDGIFTMIGTTLKPLPGTEPLKGLVVRSILPFGKKFQPGVRQLHEAPHRPIPRPEDERPQAMRLSAHGSLVERDGLAAQHLRAQHRDRPLPSAQEAGHGAGRQPSSSNPSRHKKEGRLLDAGASLIFTFLLFTAAACRYRPGYRRRHRARGR